VNEMQSAPRIPNASEIMEALDHTGFILEFKVAQILRAANFHATVNHAYTDPETGKTREIDVKGEIDRRAAREPAAVTMYSTAIIECKNTQNPLVVIGESGHNYASRTSIQVHFDPLDMNFPGKKWVGIESELGLDGLPGSPQDNDFMGHQLVRMNQQSGRWRADNNSVYDNILLPLAKAWQNELDYNLEDLDEEFPWKDPVIFLTYPIVVSAGPVFTVDVTGDNPKIKRVPWAQLNRRFKSSNLNCELVADVVSFESFEAYVKERIVNAADRARGLLAENIHLYDPQWLLSHLGMPDKADLFTSWTKDTKQHD
jgi:hypothetical protein